MEVRKEKKIYIGRDVRGLGGGEVKKEEGMGKIWVE